MVKVVCVAEKNSIAKQVSAILSGSSYTTRNSSNKYIKNYDFSVNNTQYLFPFLKINYPIEVTMTSVAGHLTSLNFFGCENNNGGGPYSWGKCDPIKLLSEAKVINEIPQKDVAQNIFNECRHAQYLIIWTDCDREGEYIGWEIFMAANFGVNFKSIFINVTESDNISNLKFTDKNTYRANFSHLEKSHIIESTRSCGKLNQNLIDAVGTRMEIDLRSGLSFTRLLTNYFKNNKLVPNETVVSYGPCQFPTLGFVVDRDDRIEKFVPENFWYLTLTLEDDIKFQWLRNHIFDRYTVLQIYESCINSVSQRQNNGTTRHDEENERNNNQADYVIVDEIKNSQIKKYKPLPLTTIELQKNCSKFFKMNAKQSLDIAEKLYQRGFVSYPRTETNKFPATMDFHKLIEQQSNSSSIELKSYSLSLLNDGKFDKPREGKNDDKAHPPIHPILSCDMTQLSVDEKKVYEYIVRHFLACCSKDAVGQQKYIKVKWGPVEAPEYFKTTSIQVLERNFLDIFPYWNWKSNVLNLSTDLNVGDRWNIQESDMKMGCTSPPKPMTESELILLMDANGIGTDATIADHIEKIKSRKYISQEKSGTGNNSVIYLKSTKLGKSLVHGFEKIGLQDSFTKPFFRSEIENFLKKISTGDIRKPLVVEQSIRKYEEYYNITNSKIGILKTVYTSS